MYKKVLPTKRSAGATHGMWPMGSGLSQLSGPALLKQVTDVNIFTRIELNQSMNTMTKAVFLVILTGGIVAIILGFIALNSVGADSCRSLTGAATDTAWWLFMSGSVAAIVGVVGLMGGYSLIE